MKKKPKVTRPKIQAPVKMRKQKQQKSTPLCDPYAHTRTCSTYLGTISQDWAEFCPHCLSHTMAMILRSLPCMMYVPVITTQVPGRYVYKLMSWAKSQGENATHNKLVPTFLILLFNRVLTWLHVRCDVYGCISVQITDIIIISITHTYTYVCTSMHVVFENTKGKMQQQNANQSITS